MDVDHTIMDSINTKRLVCYGQVEKMPDIGII